MLVSHRHRFIYTKTEKTAGTSVEVYFEPYCMGDGEWQPLHYRDEYVSPHGIIGFRGEGRPEGCRWWNHMPASLIREQVGDDVWRSYLKFCVIRNPYEKHISHFYFLRSIGKIDADPSVSEAEQFERWLLTGAKIDRNKYFINGSPCMDVFVRYESLHADLATLCLRLGVPWEPHRLPTLKSGIRPPTASAAALYTAKARAVVEKAFAFELNHFRYSFPEPAGS